MLQQQFIITVSGETRAEVNAALAAAALALSASAEPEIETGLNFDISRVPSNEQGGYSPNTLYIIGTDADGKVVVRGARDTSAAAADAHIMEAALEYSHAAEKRGVQFPERQLGGLLVRPVPAAEPPRGEPTAYRLSHITDMAKLDDSDVPRFVRSLPGLISMMKMAAAHSIETGVGLAELMPSVRYVADDESTVTVRSSAADLIATGEQMHAGWLRTKQASAMTDGAPRSDTDGVQHKGSHY